MFLSFFSPNSFFPKNIGLWLDCHSHICNGFCQSKKIVRLGQDSNSPITTARAPTISTPERLIRSIHPAGVHGTNPDFKSPVATFPSFTVDSPSTSFSHLTRSVTWKTNKILYLHFYSVLHLATYSFFYFRKWTRIGYINQHCMSLAPFSL